MTELEEQAVALPPSLPKYYRRRAQSALYGPKSEDPRLLEAENVLAALADAGYFDGCRVTRKPIHLINWTATRVAILRKAREVLVGNLRGIEIRAYLSKKWLPAISRYRDSFEFRALWRKKKVASAEAQRRVHGVQRREANDHGHQA